MADSNKNFGYQMLTDFLESWFSYSYCKSIPHERYYSCISLCFVLKICNLENGKYTLTKKEIVIKLEWSKSLKNLIPFHSY